MEKHPVGYLVGSDDRAINPQVGQFIAKRMGAHTTEVKSSHVGFISHPNEVVIETRFSSLAVGAWRT